MDRVIVYDAAIPQASDILSTNKNTLLGHSFLARAVLGGNTVVHGLDCAPTVPASMQVTIGAGSIYALDEVDATAYGDLGTDADTILKQGILRTPAPLTITAPATSGYSQVYLVQAILEDDDTGDTVLPYYNPAILSDPTAMPYAGPDNSGTSQKTLRQVKCTIALKAGAAAPAGTQTAPSPDAGYTGLYTITVANGQSSITSANIQKLTTAPFFPTLPSVPADVQSGQWVYADDTGSANALAVTPTPTPAALTKGMALRIKAANTNAGAAALAVVTQAGAVTKPIVRRDGSILFDSDIIANAIQDYVYDGNVWQMPGAIGKPPATRNLTIYVNGAIGNDANDGASNTSGHAMATVQAAVMRAWGYPPSQYTITIQVADGTYWSVNTPTYAGPNTIINGNAVTPSNVVIDGGAVTAVALNGPNTMTVQNLKVQNNVSGGSRYGFQAAVGAVLSTQNTVSGIVGSPVFTSIGGTLIPGNHTFSGNCEGFFYATHGGSIILNTGVTFTVGAALTVAVATVQASSAGTIQNSLPAPNFVNPSNVTGKRYLAKNGGVIDTQGSGSSYYPGTVAGDSTTGYYA